jgi:hypothetical protein
MDQLDCEGLVRALPLGVAGRTLWPLLLEQLFFFSLLLHERKLINHLANICLQVLHVKWSLVYCQGIYFTPYKPYNDQV